MSSVCGLVAFVAFTAAWSTEAVALRYQEHPPWMVSVGWGFGRGNFTRSSNFVPPQGFRTQYRNGAAPQIHIGRKLSQRWMVNLSYEAWLIEFGYPPVKYRETMQMFGPGVTFYPGRYDDASGGIYLRASAGLGWTGLAEVEVIEDVALDHGIRKDEWGVGFGVGGGYDFWVSHNFQLGVGMTFNYFDIGETNVDTSWFASTLLNVNLFF